MLRLCCFLIPSYLLFLNLSFDWTLILKQTLSRRTACISWHPAPALLLRLPSFSWPKLECNLQLLPCSSYSAVSSEQSWLLCQRTRGVTGCRVLGALVRGFFPSLFRGFLTTYCRSSSLERLGSVWILLVLLGPRG